MVAAIVEKLLCKNPEQRYQSCLGVYRDLKHCQVAAETHGGCVESFELGTEDVNILWKQPRYMIRCSHKHKLMLPPLPQATVWAHR